MLVGINASFNSEPGVRSFEMSTGLMTLIPLGMNVDSPQEMTCFPARTLTFFPPKSNVRATNASRITASLPRRSRPIGPRLLARRASVSIKYDPRTRALQPSYFADSSCVPFSSCENALPLAYERLPSSSLVERAVPPLAIPIKEGLASCARTEMPYENVESKLPLKPLS